MVIFMELAQNLNLGVGEDMQKNSQILMKQKNGWKPKNITSAKENCAVKQKQVNLLANNVSADETALMRFQNQSKGDVEKMSIHYETCARCDKDLVITMSDDYYFSDIDGKVLCKECYEKEQPKELIKQISDLEAKLEESEKERELDNSFWKQECDGLQKALAEKTLTIEQINKAFIENRSLWKGKYEQSNQDKISFAVKQLEKVKEKLLEELQNVDDLLDPQEYEDYHELIGCGRGYKNSIEEIDNQINVLRKCER